MKSMPTTTPPPRSPAAKPQASYPFAAFALQATLGVRGPTPASPRA